MSATSPRFIVLCITLFLVAVLLALSLRDHAHASSSPSSWLSRIGNNDFHDLPSDAKRTRVAFATFLSGTTETPKDSLTGNNEDEDDNTDGAFVSARVLIYQLLHPPTARSNTSIPILVLVTPSISPRKRARLTQDGATIITVNPPPTASSNDIHTSNALAQLHLWHQTGYEKICFLDASTLVTSSLDGVFSDESAQTPQLTLPNPLQLHPDEAALPKDYVFASHVDYASYTHVFPPQTTPSDNSALFDPWFFVFAPSISIFTYYTSLLPLLLDPADIRFKHTIGFPLLQRVLMHAHRGEGNMPWTPLVAREWNVNWPTVRDWKAGVRSFGDRYWDGGGQRDGVLKAVWREVRAEMEGFYRGREGTGGGSTGEMN